MTLEKLTEELKSACSANLKSVILYGSAAAGDHTGKRSDYNVLVVTEGLGRSELLAFSKTAKAWANAGNPAPLLFTMERLNKSTDVFPVELLDIKECHKILFGEDVVSDLDISTDNLRLQIEHELRGNLIQLRQQYLLSAGNAKEVCNLMVRSLSSFLVLVPRLTPAVRQRRAAEKVPGIGKTERDGAGAEQCLPYRATAQRGIDQAEGR